MSVYRVIDNGEVINSIVADVEFAASYAQSTGYTLELVPEAPPPAPVTDDPMGDLAELAVDHEYRLSLLELGVTDNVI